MRSTNPFRVYIESEDDLDLYPDRVSGVLVDQKGEKYILVSDC